MILVSTVDGQTYGTDQTSIFAVAVDTHEGGILSMWVTIVRLDEFPKASGEELQLWL